MTQMKIIPILVVALATVPSHHCRNQIRARRSSSSASLPVTIQTIPGTSDYEGTGGSVKAIVQGLTSFSNIFLQKSEQQARIYQKASLTPKEVLEGVIGDFENGYLFSGQIDSEIYDEDCVFTDPTLSFSGLSTFERNIKAIKPALDIFVGDSLVALYDCRVDLASQQIKAVWRMSGAVNLPWKPRIELTGNTVLSYDKDRGGRIVDYYERWDLPASTALLQLLQPSLQQMDVAKLMGIVPDVQEKSITARGGSTKTVNIKKLKETILSATVGVENKKSPTTTNLIAESVSSMIRASSVEALKAGTIQKVTAEAIRTLPDATWDLIYSSESEQESSTGVEKFVSSMIKSSPIAKFTDLNSSEGVYSCVSSVGPFSVQLASGCFQPDAEKATILIPRKKLKVVLFLGYPLKASSISLTREKDSGPVLWNLKYFDSNWRIFVAEDGNYFILQKNEITEISDLITLKIGLYANNFLASGSYDDNGAQSLAGFLMAINEINSIPSILPNVRLSVAFRSGSGVYGAITAAQAFTIANFTIDSSGKRVLESTFIRDNPIGVDVILGAGNDDETVQINQVLNHFKIVQLHTVATSTILGVGKNFPYKVQTTPIISYEGMVLQHILCYHFAYEKIAIFATDDIDGIKSTVEIGDGNYCQIETIILQTFPAGTTDFTTMISNAKASGAQIFVLFVPSATAARLLEQALDQGLLSEGTQVFGNSISMRSSIWSYFVDQSKAKDIMRGFIGIRYIPQYGIYSSDVGRGFAQRFNLQDDTVSINALGVRLCNNSTDDTGQYLYQSHNSSDGSMTCSGLQFKRFSRNGKNLFPFTAHAYDAVYALAQGVQRILSVGAKDSINGDSLHETFIKDIYFEGATGLVKFYPGMANLKFYAMGDREVGNTYFLYNFKSAVYDSTQGKKGYVPVAMWSLETGGVTPCTADNSNLLGVACDTEFEYRTADNQPSSDTPPDIILRYPVQNVGSLIAVGTLVIICVLGSLSIIVKYRMSRLIRASSPAMIYIIHFGCLIGGIRTAIGGVNITNSSCCAVFWTGHLAFGVTFSALLVKTWRVHKVVNNKTLKRVKITGNQIVYMTCGMIFGLCLYLLIATVVGKPHVDYVTTEYANQVSHMPICSFVYPELSTTLMVIEAASLMYGARLCYATKDAPDAINEAYFIASAVFLITAMCAIVFPIIFLIKSTTLGEQQLIGSMAFSIVTIFVIFIIFGPKISVLIKGGDIDMVAGFKKKTRYFQGGEIDRPFSADEKRGSIDKNITSLTIIAEGPATGETSRHGSKSKNDPNNSMFALSAPKVLSRGTYAANAALCLSQIEKWEQLMLMIEARQTSRDHSTSSDNLLRGKGSSPSQHMSSVISNKVTVKPIGR